MNVKILLLYDVLNWAWYFKALAIKENLTDYDITIKQENTFNLNDLKIYDHID